MIQLRTYQGWPISISSDTQCLDSNGDDVYMNRCDYGNVHQRWYVYRADAKGYPFKFRHVESGRCLEATELTRGLLDRKYWDARVRDCNDTSHQQWWAREGNPKYPGSSFQLQNRANLDLWLQRDWTKVYEGHSVDLAGGTRTMGMSQRV